MNTREEVIEKLERHLEFIKSQASDLYVRSLKKTIKNLRDPDYPPGYLVSELQILGFQDLALILRKAQYA